MSDYIWGNSVTAPQVGTTAPVPILSEIETPDNWRDRLILYKSIVEDILLFKTDVYGYGKDVIYQCDRSLADTMEPSPEQLDHIWKQIQFFFK